MHPLQPRLPHKLIAFALAGLTLGAMPVAAQRADDGALKQRIIADSRASYRGACPCPYDTMRNGRRCGANSAYSKPGGARPLCFDQDVTAEMLDAYRRRLPGGR